MGMIWFCDFLHHYINYLDFWSCSCVTVTLPSATVLISYIKQKKLFDYRLLTIWPLKIDSWQWVTPCPQTCLLTLEYFYFSNSNFDFRFNSLSLSLSLSLSHSFRFNLLLDCNWLLSISEKKGKNLLCNLTLIFLLYVYYLIWVNRLDYGFLMNKSFEPYIKM